MDTSVRTFLIGDIRGYTRFTLERGDEAAADLARRFAGMAETTAGEFGGSLVEVRGDEILLMFGSPRSALRAALRLQTVARAEREQGVDGLVIGIGLDAGEAVPVEDGFRGSALNRAARLCSMAAPHEILATEGIVHLSGRVEGIDFGPRGSAQLKGFSDPVAVVEVIASSGERAATFEADAAPTSQKLPIGGYLGSLAASSLVGRSNELGRATALVDAVLAGEGRLLLLAGEPGVGKTRLAQEVTQVVRNAGFLIAAGACYEAKETVALFPFQELLVTAQRVSPPSLSHRIAGDWPYLARLLPGYRTEMPPGGSDSAAEEQSRLFWNVSSYLEELARLTPVALLLDDLHWADATSLDLLQHLARQTRGSRVLIVGTYRDVEVNRVHPLESTLRELGRQHLVERVTLRRLDEEATGELVASTVGQAPVGEGVLSVIFERTEGNPFFVEEITKSLAETGALSAREAYLAIDVPESIRSVIGQRLSRLSPASQEMLRQASALGNIFHFEDLLAMDGHTERDLEAMVDEAVEIGLLTEMGSGRRGSAIFRFNHALTQQAIYAEIPPRQRRRLHLAAGAALEALPPAGREHRVAEMARHFLDADEPAKALEYLIQAGDQALRILAYREARAHFQTAVELAGETHDAQARASGSERLGTTMIATGEYSEAMKFLEEAAEHHRDAGDWRGEARCVAQIGSAHAWEGTGRAGADRIRAFLETQPDLEASPEAAMLYTSLSSVLFMSGRYEEQLEAASKAVAIAESLKDERLLGQALGRRALALVQSDEIEKALAEYERAIAISRRHQDLETLHRCLGNAGISLQSRGDSAKAGEYFREAREIMTRLGTVSSVALTTHSIVAEAFYRGDWDLARQTVESFLETRQGTPLDRGQTEGRVLLAIIDHVQTGDPGALDRLRESAGLGLEMGNSQLVGQATMWLLWSGLWEKRPQDVLADMDRFVPTARHGPARSFRSLAKLQAGDSEGAVAEIEDALQSPQSLAEACFVRYAYGRALLALGRPSEAAQALRKAAEDASVVPQVLFEAYFREVLAEALVAAGRESEAEEELERALQIFNQIKAEPSISRVRDLLSRLRAMRAR